MAVFKAAKKRINDPTGVDAIVQELGSSGIELGREETIDIIVRRELSLAGKNRVFINDQMVTQALLKRVGANLVDIHGQGEQA